MEPKGESSELQQLVSSDGDNDDSIIQDDNTDNTLTEIKVISPIRSNKISSSGNTTSQSSISHGHHKNAKKTASSSLIYINEKQKSSREPVKGSTVRPRNIHKVSTAPTISTPARSKHPHFPHQQQPPTAPHHHSFLSEVPDVRHMERALLGLLDDFHSGKLRAFASGCTMEQMTSIREQQERLARLHFDLGGAESTATTTTATSGNTAQAQQGSGGENMSQLIQRLEQLSVSIEGLHKSDRDD